MVSMDRQGLADFLRRRRAALAPDDVGLAAGRRRRTPGLRREEVAALAFISTDFYTRLEQARGSRPSEQTVGSLARALRLTLDERDHLLTDPDERLRYPPEDHDRVSRRYVANLRAVLARDASDAEARALVDALRRDSAEFARLWDEHEVGLPLETRKVIVHPAVGAIELDCQILTAENQTEKLVVFTASPGTEDAERLALLAVIGSYVPGPGAYAHGS
jgi:transcriptional regulator with XRE-family HTH domain